MKTQILNWSQCCRNRIVRTAVRFQPRQIPTILSPVRVTNRPRQSGSGSWPGLELDRTEPLDKTPTAGGLPGPIANASCHSWCWDHSSKSQLLTGVTWWISRSYCSFAHWWSASDHLVAACWVQLRRTWNCLYWVVVTMSGSYTGISITSQIVWSCCSRNWWDTVANCSSTLAFADLDIFCCRKAPFFLWNRFSASSSAVRDRSEWFGWLTSRGNSHNAHTAPITILSEGVSATVFSTSLEQSRMGAQFPASDLIMPRISFPCHELLFIKSNSLERFWRPRYRGTDVNRLSNWSLTLLAFRYLSSQCNKSLTKPKTSCCDSSGCQRR